ncbi:MAG TPA: hypothetical protein PLD25_05645 [Chloroflexota bacterium]|nr:hypothetical protein [Chloroflexota bacterium]
MERGKPIPTSTGQVIYLPCQKPGPKPLPPEIKKRRVILSLTPTWHETGKRCAEQRGLSFSDYVELLMYADLLHNKSAE